MNPPAFAQRYPHVIAAGQFSGALNNGGETITLRDRAGNVVVTVDYADEDGWPAAADGGGYSLELVDPDGDASAPANWLASSQAGGSPGTANSVPSSAAVRLNEVFASGNATNSVSASDWLEIHNTGTVTVDLTGWSVSDDSNSRRFVFPSGRRDLRLTSRHDVRRHW